MLDLVITIKGKTKADILDILKGMGMILTTEDADTFVYSDRTGYSFKYSVVPEPVIPAKK